MATGRTVEVEAICRQRSLQLFVNGNNAWAHMRASDTEGDERWRFRDSSGR